jgi:hypothetical protein
MIPPVHTIFPSKHLRVGTTNSIVKWCIPVGKPFMIISAAIYPPHGPTLTVKCRYKILGDTSSAAGSSTLSKTSSL